MERVFEMDHEHSHEYMHAHGIPHDHHDHGPDGHAHGCPEGCSADCAGCEADPRAEIVALMRYMVNHNAAHANELAQLAAHWKELGDSTAFEQVTQAVSDFEKGNMRLAAVLASLEPPKV